MGVRPAVELGRLRAAGAWWRRWGEGDEDPGDEEDVKEDGDQVGEEEVGARAREWLLKRHAGAGRADGSRRTTSRL